jgi:amidophosphoribosyltransferase
MIWLHTYGVTYGVIKPTDNLVIIDSIVHWYYIKMSIIKMMDRLNQEGCSKFGTSITLQIAFAGIDMAKRRISSF